MLRKNPRLKPERAQAWSAALEKKYPMKIFSTQPTVLTGANRSRFVRASGVKKPVEISESTGDARRT